MGGIGDTLGRYTLLKRLAGGGMGEVFVAAVQGPAGLGKPVALKVLRQELASDQTFVSMLIDEAKISQFLNHQNIVSVLDFGEHEGTYFLAMEFVQGVTVEQLVDLSRAKQRRLELPVSLYVAIELAKALKYAHGRTNELGEPLNIVHRDVTPANVLLSVQGEVKLTDFGIARAVGRIHQTQAGVVKGKFGYLAPEMTRYEQIDARADLFSFGVLLYQLCAGIHPVAGASVMEAIFRYEEKHIRKPSEHNPEIIPALDAIIMRCLEPKPVQRWASAQALGAALQDVAMSRPEWRRGMQQSAQLLADLIRELAPDALKDPLALAREAAPNVWGGLAPSGRGNAKVTISPSTADSRARGGVQVSPAPSADPRARGGVQVSPVRAATPPARAQDPADDTAAAEPADGEQATLEMAAVSADLVASALAPKVIPRGAPHGRPTEPSDAFLDALPAGNDFGGPTSTDMPRLAEPELPHRRSGRDTLDEEATRIAASTFGDTTSNNPALPDPDAETGLEQTIDTGLVVDDEEALAEPVIDRELAPSSGFGDKTIADGSMQAIRPPTDDLVVPTALDVDPDPSGSDDELGYEPTRLRPGEGSAASAPRITEIPDPAVRPVPIAQAGFGGNTDRWIAGQLDASALSWSDDDAARRAIETRHLARGPASPAVAGPSFPTPQLPPTPIVVGGPSPAAAGPSFPTPQLPPTPIVVGGPGPSAQPHGAPPQPYGGPSAQPHGAPLSAQPYGAPPQPFGAPPQPYGAPLSAQPYGAPPSPQPFGAPPQPFAPAPSFTGPAPGAVDPRRRTLVLAIAAGAAVVLALAGALAYPRFTAPVLQIQTVPPGATVTVDGAKSAGVTPLSLEVQPGAAIALELELEGYERAVRELDPLDRGQTFTFAANLRRKLAEVRVSPVAARVTVNGKELGEGTAIKLGALDPAEPVDLVVSADGYAPFQTHYERGTKVPAVLEVTLTPL